MTFDGVHSTQYGLDVQSDKSVGLPAKKKITVDIPYSSSVIDLSGLYGIQAYEEIEIEVPFHVMDRVNMQKERLYMLWHKAINWLESKNSKVWLVDDVDPDWHYLAEVQEAPSWDEFKTAHGTLTVKFTAYPFRIKNTAEGDDVWDTFNFDTDIAQVVEYDISGSKTIELYNLGLTQSTPAITATGSFKIESNGVSFEVETGTSEVDWALAPGLNTIVITGTGHIAFNFHREAI